VALIATGIGHTGPQLQAFSASGCPEQHQDEWQFDAAARRSVATPC
jgi:hypothetical protein